MALHLDKRDFCQIIPVSLMASWRAFGQFLRVKLSAPRVSCGSR